MQNKYGLRICQIAPQSKAWPEVYKDPGPNPSGIRDLKERDLQQILVYSVAGLLYFIDSFSFKRVRMK